MKTDPRDDFSAFATTEHMFFGLDDPALFMRRELERGLGKQVAGTVVDAITTEGEPKFLTMARKADDTRVIVSWFAIAVRARVTVTAAALHEVLPTTLTLLFGHVDERGKTVSASFTDLHADAEVAFSDDVFKRRFLEFRARDQA